MKNSAQLIGTRINNDCFSNGYIWILDASIGLGAGKILTVLALDANHYTGNAAAPTLQDVHCIGVSVSVTWTGESVANFLQKLIAVFGRPAAYLKDGGTDLGKAVRLLKERGLPSQIIDDISHVAANLLKHEYANHPMFKTFLTSCGKVSKNLKQTVLACLAPPKVSTKARFMNLHRLVKWADKLLQHSPKGAAVKGSKLEKLRSCFGELPGCKPFISRFHRDAQALLECQKLIKNNGLSHEAYDKCQEIIDNIPVTSSVRQGFESWAINHLEVAQALNLEHKGMPISSDCIESLFGVTKVHGTGQVKDANRMALRLPALCGKVTTQDAASVLDIGVKEQQELEETFFSLAQQRRQVLPNPGNLEKIDPDGEKQGFELIARPEKQAKNHKNNTVLNICDNSGVPAKSRTSPVMPAYKIQSSYA